MCGSSFNGILDIFFGIRKAPASIFVQICYRAGSDNHEMTIVSKYECDISAQILVA